ncbi:DgyrCDS9940 [Dimorphilus gyrociliatus]|uniref:DgyrCDS9940 n=1 Tax=Dimorphilus gyrociliatus TaxID=2664684 RepID=A0A7I8VZU3_9ANNE|nr:DgyrCDS9940 [Dimorphilus gyrociliatus]
MSITDTTSYYRSVDTNTSTRPSSSSSSRSLSSVKHYVIPPIITCEKDRAFLKSIYSFIDDELKEVGEDDLEQRYIVHKAAFDQVIEYVTAYKPILTAIKSEYENCISAVKLGKEEAEYLTQQLKKKATEPSTVNNLVKRSKDLMTKIEKIENDNEKLKTKLEDVRRRRSIREQEDEKLRNPPPPEVKQERRNIPGLTPEEQVQEEVLLKKLRQVESDWEKLKEASALKFAPKNRQEELKAKLNRKVEKADELKEKKELARIKRHKLQVAVKAAEDYLKQPSPHQTIGETVSSALAKTSFEMKDDVAAEEDDPTKEREAERMLEYIDRFNELLDEGLYESAAYHAAISPKGILRIPETVDRLKEINEPKILMIFCEALCSTSPAYKQPVSGYLATVCVQTALKEKDMDALSHWVTQNQLDLSEADAELIEANCMCNSICTCRRMQLSHRIYTSLRLFDKAAVCLARISHVSLVVSFCKVRQLEVDSYIKIIKRLPNMDLVLEMLESNCVKLVDIFQALDEEKGHLLLKILRDKEILSELVWKDQTTSSNVWDPIVNNMGDIDLLSTVIVGDIMKAVRQKTFKSGENKSYTPSSSQDNTSVADSENSYLGDLESNCS